MNEFYKNGGNFRLYSKNYKIFQVLENLKTQQCSGEIILIFPKVYHMGFCQNSSIAFNKLEVHINPALYGPALCVFALCGQNFIGQTPHFAGVNPALCGINPKFCCVL